MIKHFYQGRWKFVYLLLDGIIGEAMDIKIRINKCKTMKELDALRLNIANDMKHFLENQRLFIKQKNRIRRGSV